ncbi:MAG: PAS domain-containing protein [Bryobacterales bacterium]|nr:PAS domain-containing protein [Bryobacterales bacterium]
MSKRFVYTSGVLLLVLLTSLVVWQISFHFGEYAPKDLSQTYVFWAVSSLVFVLTVTLGFILFRTAFKLYLERRTNREGSRIKSKLFFGAFALSFLPVCFMVVFSYGVLNRNLNMWFTRPAEGVKLNYIEIGVALDREMRDGLRAQAALLASRPEVRALLDHGTALPRALLSGFLQEWRLAGVAIRGADGGPPLASHGSFGANSVTVRHSLDEGDRPVGTIDVSAAPPLDLVAARQQIDRYLRAMDQLRENRNSARWFYILMQALIGLFILFVSTWIALVLARQISVPISALLKGAEEVRQGNLAHRVETSAIDELGVLVRGFNQMTRELESNRNELDARRRFTEAILESIPTGVISIAADGSIRRVNRAFRAMFRAHWEAAPPRRLEEVFSREDAAEMRYLMKRARRTGGASREIDVRIDGQIRHLSVTVSALDETVTSGFVVVVEDLSDLLRAQKAAAWHEVARRVAHEIRNPLTPITLSAQRIERQVARLELPPETARILRECAATIGAEAESVQSLVEEFAQFARFPAAQPVRADLNEVVEGALSIFRGRLDGIRLTTDLAPGLAPVLLDPEQFRRVIVNLVDNAAEAMQESPVKELLVATRPGSRGTVELAVADTGCGVSVEDKEKLFLPYFSTKGRGTGLGLAIVNHILADHGAQVRVEDHKPAGAVFTIEIPVLIETAEPADAVPVKA